MADSIESVNAAARLYRRWISEATEETSAVNLQRWTTTADGLDAAAEELTRLRTMLKPIPAEYGDVSDLPPELMAQLSGIKTDELEDQIFAIVKVAGDQIELDRILIELFRRHGEVHQRRFINNKLWRMGQKGMVYSVAGRKGIYTVERPASFTEEPSQGGFSSAPKAAPREDFSADLDDEIPF